MMYSPGWFWPNQTSVWDDREEAEGGAGASRQGGGREARDRQEESKTCGTEEKSATVSSTLILNTVWLD